MDHHETDAGAGERLAYTPRKAAALLGIGRDIAYPAIRDGWLPATRVGGRQVIPAVALCRRMAEAAASLAATGSNPA